MVTIAVIPDVNEGVARRVPRAAHGFTLIELLVVIGILALLVAVLLPALGAARRQAATIRCAASLRELHRGFEMYAIEYKGYWPVYALRPREGLTYSIGDDVFPMPPFDYPAYWHNFIAKYITKTKQGYAARTPLEQAEARKAVTWGCPAWSGFPTKNPQLNRTGYGMNLCPTFTADAPTIGVDWPPFPHARLEDWPTAADLGFGRFFKETEYTHPAERALLGDSYTAWIWSKAALMDRTFPRQLANSPEDYYPPLPGQTHVDIYRHGKVPSRAASEPGFNAPLLSATGGRVGYNILYCDGHVVTHTDPVAAYLSIRMRYPG